MAGLLAAKQPHTDYTLAKNVHKLTKIRLEALYAVELEVYSED